ncbi:hypothetical protein DDB_G0290917 [Dictyostelium discoideum AX4]|uniref:Uncharacterized protein n=1 Tax=Dictyostelium discoideum TaxID=44689 RepID=Q54FE4_DICDI|nr:hypothetical protein DDB_G0290917 [Dictyostelium discoideum AX4]EAL61974.1 hypothetical protein DDB_G0290917 [Dictyostelium discoideum AX4]|eukprot:XP_635478.1 hypothetical protein DDB_G0290917 [Dictyostelium discoideum AX4]
METQTPHPPNSLDNAIPITTTSVIGENGKHLLLPNHMFYIKKQILLKLS